MSADKRWIRTALVTFTICILSLPWVIPASQRVLRDCYNVPYQWVSPEFGPRQKFDSFTKRFSRYGTIVLSYEGCTVDDRRLGLLRERLLSDHQTADGHRLNDLFVDVHNGYDAIRQMTEAPLELPRGVALERLRGTLVGQDLASSCAVISISRLAESLRGRTPEILREVCAEITGIAENEIVLGGSLLEGVEIDEESQRSSHLILPSAVISFVLCLFCLRSLWMAIPLFAIAMVGQGFVIAICEPMGIEMNAVLLVLAPLVFTLTMSGGVHFANYYREEVAHTGAPGAMKRALRLAALPCWLATFTTAVGLASLSVSNVIPVRQFGYLGAIGVIASFACLFLTFPGMMLRWPPTTLRASVPLDQGLQSAVFLACSRIVNRWGIPISLFAILALIWGVMGVSKLSTSVDVLDLLRADSRIVKDYQWLESRIGPLVPLELIVEFSEDDPRSLIARTELISQIQTEITKLPGSGGSLSAVSFLPPIPRAGGIRGGFQRTTFEKRVAKNLDQFVEAGYLFLDGKKQSWRIVVRTPAMGDENRTALLNELESLSRFLAQQQSPGAKEVSAQLTGILPLVRDTQQMLLQDLTSSFLTAFVLIGLVMMLATRSVAFGALAMIPNIFPVLTVFGFLGWKAIPIDIGTMMTASVALGIAVDGTLHFLTNFRRERSRQASVDAAVAATLQHCGRAMWHATLICGVGMLVFCLSEFVPTQRFAVMMLALLIIALLSDILLFPALLLGPFRSFFPARDSAQETEDRPLATSAEAPTVALTEQVS